MTEQPKSDNLTLYIVIGICVVIVIVLIIVFCIIKKKSKKELRKVSEPTEVTVENTSAAAVADEQTPA